MFKTQLKSTVRVYLGDGGGKAGCYGGEEGQERLQVPQELLTIQICLHHSPQAHHLHRGWAIIRKTVACDEGCEGKKNGVGIGQ